MIWVASAFEGGRGGEWRRVQNQNKQPPRSVGAVVCVSVALCAMLGV